MEAVGQLAAGVAQDFNNIMTIIKVHADLLKEETELPNDADESLNAISDAAARATSLTKQLLAFSRKRAMSLSVIDLNEELVWLSKVLRSLLSERIELQCDLTASPAIVSVDVGMIGQILTNLAVNARDAIPEGGVLAITTSRVAPDNSVSESPDAYVRLKVSDTGIGIAADVLPHVFEPFFSTKDVGKGTGLGLFTVYGLVDQHGGRITIVSEEPDRDPGRKTVLVVEDELPLRQVIQTVLKSKGYEPLLALNGQDALEKWKGNSDRIQALLTDIVMPGDMTGFELAEKIQREAPTLPVIFMSGCNVKINEEGEELKEGYDYLPKPFDSQSLASIVNRRVREAAAPTVR